MTDELSKVIDDQALIYAKDIKNELGLDESKISDDEAISSASAASLMEKEGVEQRELERWIDIEKHLENLTAFEAKVFKLSFSYSADQIAVITGKSKNQVVKAKSLAKKKLMGILKSSVE